MNPGPPAPSLSPARPPKAKAPAAPRMPKISWLEIVVLAQALLPAIMFIPQLLPLRFLTRVASFALPLSAWALFTITGRKVAGGRTYPPVYPLSCVAVWLTLSILHPTVNTLTSALCAVGITLGVCCPAFWAPAAITDIRQLRRLVVLMLLCNGASAVVGMAQIYRPDTFRPPKIAMFELHPELEESLMVRTDDGRSFLRPPGLTDSPGGAALGGVASCAFGLAVVLGVGPWWQRLLSFGLALIGATILFYCQVRSLTITLLLGIMFWAFLLLARREIRKLTMLLACLGLIGVAAIGWVMRDGGSSVLKRFVALFEDRAATVYYKNRGAFLEHGLTVELPLYPLGAGPGRVGMASGMFGSQLVPPDRRPLYAESQIEVWVLDGGAPLLILYPLALILAMFSAARTAVKCPDPEVAYWTGAMIVYAVATMVGIFGGQPFMSPMGVQFWALLGAVYGAQELSRVNAAKARAKAQLRTAAL